MVEGGTIKKYFKELISFNYPEGFQTRQKIDITIKDSSTCGALVNCQQQVTASYLANYAHIDLVFPQLYS